MSEDQSVDDGLARPTAGVLSISTLFSLFIFVSACALRGWTNYQPDYRHSMADLWLWCAIAQLLALGIVLVTSRKLLTFSNSVVPGLSMLAVFTASGLMFVDQFNQAAFWLLEFVVCLFMLSCWVMLTIGTLWLGYQAFRPKRTRAKWFPVLAKCWLVAVSFVGTAEVAVRLFAPEPRLSGRLNLPNRYATPDPDSLQITAIGGSTMMGFPYQPKVSIPAFLGAFLRQSNHDKKIVVTNLAIGGINFRMAAEELKASQVRPDLLLLYTGHNEYFHDHPETLLKQRWPGRFTNAVLGWNRVYQVLFHLIPQSKLESQSMKSEGTRAVP